MLSYKAFLAVAIATATTVYGQITLTTTPTYDYTFQGANWNDPAWTCLSTDTTIQSPVDVTSLTPSSSPDRALWSFHAQSYDRFMILQNLHSIRVVPSTAGYRASISYQYENKYYLQYYDIRAPSEHLVDGKRAELEIQLIFENESLNYAGLSFLYNSAAEGDIGGLDFVRALSEQGPTYFNATAEGGYESLDSRYNVMLDALSMAQSADTKLIEYNGSSTYPPCAENYNWFVYAKIMSLPIADITPIAEMLNYAGTSGNYRAVPTANQAGIRSFTYANNDYEVFSGAFGAGVSTVVALVVAMSISMQL